jgi:hypothetical protein
MNWFTDKINREFDFLNTSGFKGPFERNLSREMHAIYVKKCLILDFGYDGYYFIDLTKTKTLLPELEENIINIYDLDYSDFSHYELRKLDFKNRLFNSVYFNDRNEKFFWYYRQLLLQNPEILNGNLYKLSLKYRLLRILGLKK